MSDITLSSGKTRVGGDTGTIALTGADWGLLAARLGLGIIFLAHGGQKLFGWFHGPGLTGTIGFMHGMLGIPVLLAYLAVFTEFFGGIALILGVLSRLAALGLIITMLVAVAKVHFANGFFLDSSKIGGHGPGYEYNVALIALALTVVLTGPGRIAIADIERRWLISLLSEVMSGKAN